MAELRWRFNAVVLRVDSLQIKPLSTGRSTGGSRWSTAVTLPAASVSVDVVVIIFMWRSSSWWVMVVLYVVIGRKMVFLRRAKSSVCIFWWAAIIVM